MMPESQASPACPDCVETPRVSVDRRQFVQTVAATTVATGLLSVPGASLLTAAPPATASKPAAKVDRQAEMLIQELFGTLTADQKKEVLPFDHGSNNGKATPTRMRMYNRAIGKTIEEVYTKPQTELIERILKAISSGEQGMHYLTRGGTFDNSGSLEGCGVTLFGDPTNNGKYAWVFAGHHLTVRCDGDSQADVAFGGPIYYGHSPNGYSDKNVFLPQTKAVLSVFDALDEGQRKLATVTGSPGEQEASIRFRPQGQPRPGIALASLKADQRKHVEDVMRTVLAPYRQTDVDEVMEIIRTTGGMDAIHLAFYRDKTSTDDKPWHFWRLEGPGIVWNFRVLPHVHTFVQVARKSI
ncbi:DUF3500 domain-containing protein [Tuwongella immobilis]|uniref:DUF3500 domain-containing protein n=1 Tax=Tuwongella immobilis TaxID=692036 RepID=A0A6C2YI57_9BACT|nr:DUF3500 domain-containing protein [Tuwongella immobilis]VIP00949.1 Uncharacterized protein OS=Chthoniobacter flavus Ellin428 GN=CfE428DRAFT_1616 PE=4 SV=1: DUF3500 [Tuwongella immobilis]VTR97316.1 Uncharacterized protein OS=Chthoniobacter flavus Ellin428 GN=CfE428DRAFT_1616 PE=4 SV=1: DUF3500 [Tuwongella immobilis]